MTWRERLFARRRMRRDLAEEIQAHLDEKVDELVAAGMPLAAATAAARRAIGNVPLIEQRSRETWRWSLLEDFLADLRHALRQLRREPGFTAACVLTLGLGLGANLAIFSVLDTVLLRPLPFKDPGRLLLLTEHNPVAKVEKTGAPYPDFVAWRDRNRVFEQIAAYWPDEVVLGGAGEAQHLRSAIVTDGFFALLGVGPAIGRRFPGSEHAELRPAGGGRAFMIADALWRRRFGASAAAVGRIFRLDGGAATLIGVLPPGFQFPDRCEVWLPLGVLTGRQLSDRVSHPFRVLGRARPGIRPGQAQAEMDGIQRQQERAYPDTAANWRVKVTPLLDELVGNLRLSLLVLSGAVALILLIACANVVNLLLARAVAREPELAIRAALGAGRLRLVRQAGAETLAIVAIGTLVALALARWGLHAMVALSGGTIRRLAPLHLDARLLTCAAALAALTTILVGLIPALLRAGSSLQESLRDGRSSAATSRSSRRLREALVATEVALTLPLLCAAGLLLSSFMEITTVHPGFAPEHLWTMKVAWPEARYPTRRQRTDFLERLLGEIRALPGVAAAAATSTLPFSGEANWASIEVAGRPALHWGQAPTVELRTVSADYFRTMGIAFLRGRGFSPGDEAEATRVAVVNAAIAQRFWPGVDPVGRRLTILDERPRSRQVIGVVGNVKSLDLGSADDPEIYLHHLNRVWPPMTLVVRGAPGAAGLATAVRRQAAALDKEVPLYEAAAMDRLLARSLTRRRFDLTLLGALAALALLLAAVGVYGLLAFAIGRRRSEIGLRMALGAPPRRILRLVLWQGMRPVLFGLALGAGAAFAVTRLIAGLLYGVSPADPLTFAGVAFVLGLAATAACAVPSWRAIKVAPMAALRCESPNGPG